MDFEFYLIPLLALHTLFGFWLARRFPRNAKTAGPQAPASPVGECPSRLAELGHAIQQHSVTLQDLFSVLKSAHQTEFSAGLGRALPRVQTANGAVRRQMDDTLLHLYPHANADRPTLTESILEIAAHRIKVVEFDHVLDSIDQLQGPTELKAQLSSAVESLLVANQHLRSNLVEKQRQLEERQDELAQALRDARCDHLTGLPNRRAFEERITDLQGLFERHQEPYILVVFDIDRFKRINDEYGHATGDAVLAMVAKILSNRKRGTDHLSRIGGEEFALLMPLQSLDAGQAVADEYRLLVEAARLKQNGREFQVTVSGGVARIQTGESFEQLILRADDALYNAKNAGRNCTRIADEGSLVTENQTSEVIASV